jgi:enoyl-CoA hydratase
MGYDEIIYEKKDRIGRITLNRPHKLNALSPGLLAELDRALQDANDDMDISVVIIRGAGRAFCSGYDLTMAYSGASPAPQGMEDILRIRHREIGHTERWLYLWNLSKPTIGEVQGYCLAGGTELAAACDIVICAEDAQFGYPIVRGTGTAPCLLWAYLMNQRKTKEYLFTGDYISGTEAVKLGLANHAVPVDKLEGEVNALAERIAKVPIEMLTLNKAAVNAAYEAMGFREGINHCLTLHLVGHATEAVLGFERAVREKGLRGALEERDRPFEK